MIQILITTENIGGAERNIYVFSTSKYYLDFFFHFLAFLSLELYIYFVLNSTYYLPLLITLHNRKHEVNMFKCFLLRSDEVCNELQL